jgi:molybdopterin converting factor small subunit
MFAGARERVGSEAIEIQVDMPVTVRQLKVAISNQFESLRTLVEFGRIAIDNEFVDDSQSIDSTGSQSVVALIPPVSGG